ncbi:MAG: PP2C family serine/threonine-protein phosphatase [Methanoregula sp.]|jgi:serine/threonine protein phosphatase PrpC|uniref:PP2C family serine/threonine-protein phosphatase n=1 Tax=Methanoregula sp. TaxID=2052170 RepID=UPI003D0C381C
MPSPEEFSCTCDTGLGWVFGCSRTGAAHIRTGRPCEDAYALWSGSSGAQPCIAFAVADGHGDPRHDQSRTGAALAVNAAISELVAFHRSYADGDIPRQQFRAGFKTDLPRRATRRWRDLVVQDAGKRILPPASVPPSDGQDQHFTRYGTTLIAALVVNDSILVGQIGDGDLLLVRPDGGIEFPLPRDPVLAGNETHSLSSPDAHLLWRTATLDRGDGGILLAATDGISDSFNGAESEEFSIFVHSLVDRIRTYGTEAVAAAISGWLDRYSEIASGDDMTLVWACINPEEKQSNGPGPEMDTPVSASEGW